MNQIIKNQSGGVDISPKKLYTQSEVNDFHKDWEDNLSLREKDIIDETLDADRQKRLDDRIVSNLVKKSNRILVSITSHAFPVDFFPDIINVEEGRVTIVIRSYLNSEVHSVDIKNISNIFINSSYFFSQLVIASKTFENNEIKIRNLRTDEAISIRRIIEGLRIFESQQINTTNYTRMELVNKLNELSTTAIVM